jgi:hypothetical protein
MTLVQHSSKTSDLTIIHHCLVNYLYASIMKTYCLILSLQKRALRLQQTKQKAALHREQQRELQLQRETDLIAKPVSSNSEQEKSS